MTTNRTESEQRAWLDMFTLTLIKARYPTTAQLAEGLEPYAQANIPTLLKGSKGRRVQNIVLIQGALKRLLRMRKIKTYKGCWVTPDSLKLLQEKEQRALWLKARGLAVPQEG